MKNRELRTDFGRCLVGAWLLPEVCGIYGIHGIEGIDTGNNTNNDDSVKLGIPLVTAQTSHRMLCSLGMGTLD